MKKVMILGVALMAVLAFNSCKKDYTCECTSTTNQSGNYSSTSSFTITDTKKNAEEQCEGSSSSVTSGTYTATTTCELQ